MIAEPDSDRREEFVKRMHAHGYRVGEARDADAYVVSAPNGEKMMVSRLTVESVRVLDGVVSQIRRHLH